MKKESIDHALTKQLPLLQNSSRLVIPTDHGDLVLEGKLKYKVLDLIVDYLDAEHEMLRLDEMYKEGWSP